MLLVQDKNHHVILNANPVIIIARVVFYIYLQIYNYFKEIFYLHQKLI